LHGEPLPLGPLFGRALVAREATGGGVKLLQVVAAAVRG